LAEKSYDEMIYFLIPLFNEEGNIRELASSLVALANAENKHYVLVNDCSTDRTAALIPDCFPNERYTLLTNPVNSGPGYSFNAGMEFIINHSQSKSDIIITLEGDNTSDLSLAPLMIELIRQWNFDLVLSSVYAQGGGFSQTSLMRKMISFVANQFLRFFFDIKVLTLSSFYRAYSITLIRKVKSDNDQIIKESGFICALELLVKAIRAGAKIIEIPMMLHSNKRVGKSKMKIIKTSFEYLKFLLRYSMK